MFPLSPLSKTFHSLLALAIWGRSFTKAIKGPISGDIKLTVPFTFSASENTLLCCLMLSAYLAFNTIKIVTFHIHQRICWLYIYIGQPTGLCSSGLKCLHQDDILSPLKSVAKLPLASVECHLNMHFDFKIFEQTSTFWCDISMKGLLIPCLQDPPTAGALPAALAIHLIHIDQVMLHSLSPKNPHHWLKDFLLLSCLICHGNNLHSLAVALFVVEHRD